MALPPRPPMICSTAWEGVFAARFGLFCEQVQSHRNEKGNTYWTGGYEYTISAKLWLMCAHFRCLWCRFLARQFLQDLKARSRERLVDNVHVRIGREWMSWSEVVIVVNGADKTFVLRTVEGDPAAAWLPKRILIPHVGWPYALAEAKACIDKCIRDHPACRAITWYDIGRAPLPTRLIDCSHPDFLRIVEPDHSMRGTYIALSYVWGEDQPHQLTESNLSRYKVKIDVALPQTILDAIRVTRALGISLVWIDSLCIVQDSERDMHHELARMRDVYRHAFLTIDAGSAARVSEGFLQDRRLEPLPTTVLPFICPPNRPFAEGTTSKAQLGTIYVTGIRDMYFTKSDTESNDFGSLSHTVSRGWCLQERLLSTRSLVFTTQTLQLRCHTETKNVGGAFHDGRNDVPRLPGAVLHRDRHVARGSYGWGDIHYRWWEIVKDYTGRKLSNMSDRLVAISGLAEIFSPTLGPGYVAGLWRDTLLEDLLWCSNSRSSLKRTGYHGPSWSWASTGCAVQWGFSWTMHSFAEVVRCIVTLQNQNLPFGVVTGASLILSSSLLPCRWSVDETGSKSWKCLLVEFPFFSSFPPEDQYPSPLSDCYYDEDVALLEELWFVPLAHGDVESPLPLKGLLITKTDGDVWQGAGEQDHCGDVYRRVAIADCWTSLIDHKDRDETYAMYPELWDMLSQLPRVDIELV
ncbi:heterokaryon incompatibility protein-domain-containing protein [Cubamyces lactineus]|nr:heterokaryon incompatibility protein-domain-containing protein [Cubamyces lactineus]